MRLSYSYPFDSEHATIPMRYTRMLARARTTYRSAAIPGTQLNGPVATSLESRFVSALDLTHNNSNLAWRVVRFSRRSSNYPAAAGKLRHVQDTHRAAVVGRIAL